MSELDALFNKLFSAGRADVLWLSIPRAVQICGTEEKVLQLWVFVLVHLVLNKFTV